MSDLLHTKFTPISSESNIQLLCPPSSQLAHWGTAVKIYQRAITPSQKKVPMITDHSSITIDSIDQGETWHPEV
jgi:hypothetical protein